MRGFRYSCVAKGHMPAIPLLLSAGEASGDLYAARLATALRARADVSLFGMGGSHMRAAGVELIADCAEVSVVGFSEVLRRLPALRRAMRRLLSEAKCRRPPLAILTDFPSFHLRLARNLYRRGIRNVYYVCPQFWAWRPWRARLVRRWFVQALCIFPFEEQFYSQAGVPVRFIGHPLVGEARASLSRQEFCRTHGLDPAEPVVTVLPGSRYGEISHHSPALTKACQLIRREQSNVQFVLAAAPDLDAGRLRAALPLLALVQGQTYDALAAADAAIVSSGTATMEAALLDVPMVVIYRLTPLSALLVKPFVRTPFFSMVNLIAGHRVVTELIQDDFTPTRVADETLRLLRSPAAVQEVRRGLAEVRTRLGPGGAVERAAEAIAALLRA
jgi:lipid-A-disaccharide synthase